MPYRPLLTPEQVAQHLGVGVQTLYQWRYAGTGPVAVRVGKYLRYRPEDIDAWLQANESAPEGRT